MRYSSLVYWTNIVFTINKMSNTILVLQILIIVHVQESIMSWNTIIILLYNTYQIQREIGNDTEILVQNEQSLIKAYKNSNSFQLRPGSNTGEGLIHRTTGLYDTVWGGATQNCWGSRFKWKPNCYNWRFWELLFWRFIQESRLTHDTKIIV